MLVCRGSMVQRGLRVPPAPVLRPAACGTCARPRRRALSRHGRASSQWPRAAPLWAGRRCPRSWRRRSQSPTRHPRPWNCMLTTSQHVRGQAPFVPRGPRARSERAAICREAGAPKTSRFEIPTQVWQLLRADPFQVVVKVGFACS